MRRVWEVSAELIAKSVRQGDVLIHPELFPPGVDMSPLPSWEVPDAPSHRVEGRDLAVSRRSYFVAPRGATITHPSHKPVSLPPGEYRIYVPVEGGD